MTGEMPKWLAVLGALQEDLSLVRSANIVTHNSQSVNLELEHLMSSSSLLALCTYMVPGHTCRHPLIDMKFKK